MRLDEAIALYLYLQANDNLRQFNMELATKSWKVIAANAESQLEMIPKARGSHIWGE